MLSLMLCFIQFRSIAPVCCILVLSLCGLVVCLIKKKGKAFSAGIVFTAVLLSCVLFLLADYRHDATLGLTGENTRVSAVVTEEPVLSDENGRYYFVARLKQLSGERAYGKIRLSFTEKADGIEAENLSVGDRIVFNAYTYKIGSDNVGIHNYYNSLGIYTGGYSIDNLEIEKPDLRPLSYYFSVLHGKLISIIRMGFSNEAAGVIIAVLTGNKAYTADEIYSYFKFSGVAHFMAVSGMHLSVWMLFLSFLSERLKLQRMLSIVLLVLAVIFVIFLSCFSPSVMRAGLMSLLYLLSRALKKDSDGMNSLGFAAIILIFINPYIVMNVGFMLSFISVAAIFILALPVSEHFDKKIAAIKSPVFTGAVKKLLSVCAASVCISLSVMLFTYPVSVMAFGGISAVSPVTNLILFYSTPVILVLTVLYLIFSAVPFLSTAISFFLNLTVTQSINVTRIMSSFSFSYFTADTDTFALWLLIFISVMAAAYMLMGKREQLVKFTVSAIIAAVAFSGFMAVRSNLTGYKVTVLEVGEVCSCLVTMNSRSVLVGVGENYYFEDNLADVLEQQNSGLEAVVLPETADSEQLGYITSQYRIGTVDKKGEAVELFGKVKIENMGDSAKITGNGNSITVFFGEHGDTEESEGIVIDKSGYILSDGNRQIFNINGITFTVKENSRIKTGR